MKDHIEFSLQLQAEPPLPNEEVDDMILSIMSELRAIPSVVVERGHGEPAPSGAKSDMLSFGYEVFVAISGGVATAVFPSALRTVNDWLGRQPKGTKIIVKHLGATLEISGTEAISAEAIAPLIQNMLSEK